MSEEGQEKRRAWRNPNSAVETNDAFWEGEMTIDGVLYRRHPNGGGWVSDAAQVAPTAGVGIFARVDGRAIVCGRTEIAGNTRICGKVVVEGDVYISGNGSIAGH